jgi:hypothetical protein
MPSSRELEGFSIIHGGGEVAEKRKGGEVVRTQLSFLRV